MKTVENPPIMYRREPTIGPRIVPNVDAACWEAASISDCFEYPFTKIDRIEDPTSDPQIPWTINSSAPMKGNFDSSTEGRNEYKIPEIVNNRAPVTVRTFFEAFLLRIVLRGEHRRNESG